MDIALRQLLSKADRSTLQRKARYFPIDPEESDEDEFESVIESPFKVHQQTHSGKPSTPAVGDLEMQFLANAGNIPMNIPVGLPGNKSLTTSMKNDMDATKLLDSSNSAMTVSPAPAAGKKPVAAKKVAPATKGKKAVTPDSDSGSEEDSSEES